MAKLTLTKESNAILTQAVVNGIDTTNVIDSFTNTQNTNVEKSYTATQDCYAVASTAGTITFIKVDDVPVANNVACIPLKKGQTIKSALDGSRQAPYNSLTIYGVKR